MKESTKRATKPQTSTLLGWHLGPDYEFVREIGKGAYAQVLEALEIKTGRRVAIKPFLCGTKESHRAKYCLREMEILSKAKHGNVVKVHDVFTSSQDSSRTVYMVMEFFPYDLARLVRSSTCLEPIQVKKLLYELLLALNYLHSAGVLHRDLKPANILLDENCQLRICDFGLARSVCGLTAQAFDPAEGSRHPGSGQETYDGSKGEVPEGGEDVSQCKYGKAVDLEDEDVDIPEEREGVPSSPTTNLADTFTVCLGKPHIRSLSPSKRGDMVTRSSASGTQISQKPRSNRVPLLHALSLSPTKLVSKQHSVDHPPLPVVHVKPRRQTADIRDPVCNLLPDSTTKRKELEAGAKQMKTLKRELTAHVVTRWYRAPEVILLERLYNSSIDMWSVGCVFAELLQMLPGNAVAWPKRRALFPGTSCQPLSPPRDSPNGVASGSFEPDDQLLAICRILGTPSASDVEFISDEGARLYLQKLPRFAGVDFAQLYPACSAEALDLLKKLLTFNPYYRITAHEALAHPYLAPVRTPARETLGEPMILNADQDCNYDDKLFARCRRI